MTINHKRTNTTMKLVGVVCFFGLICLSLPAMALPPEIEADRLLLSAVTYMDQGNHAAADVAFKKIIALKTNLRVSFYYQYGRHLYAIGNLKKAAKNLETYCIEEGSGGRYYEESLRMLTALEPAIQQQQKELSRFVNNGEDGTVTDTKTGLEWKVGPVRITCWNEAWSWVQSLNLDGGGWRMPTMDELEGLYKKGVGSHNITPLLNTNSKYLWVWSGETKGSSDAWGFPFFDGHRDCGHRDLSRYSRAFAVRSRK